MPKRNSNGFEYEIKKLPFEMGNLPEIYQKKAEEELHETPERRALCIQQLREKLKHDNVTKDLVITEKFMLQNLRARKFNVDRALRNVKDAANYARTNSFMFTDFRFDVSVRVIRENIMTILPWRCHEGCAIFVVELENWKPSNFPLEEFQRTMVILLLQALKEPMTQVNGFKFLINVDCNSFRYLKICTPRVMYQLYHGTQEAIPARYRGIHIVKDSLVFKTGWLVVKPFLTEKIRKRFFFHSSTETLLKHFPRSVLPKSFGGDLTDYDQSNWLKRAMEPEQLDDMFGGSYKNVSS